MHDNIINIAHHLAWFGLFLLLALLVLAFVSKKYAGRKIDFRLSFKIPNNPTSFLKFFFVVLLLHLVVFVSLKHSGIACEDLDARARCNCYGLKLREASSEKEKRRLAELGTLVCPNSTWFKTMVK